jgi:hypothetical protein
MEPYMIWWKSRSKKAKEIICQNYRFSKGLKMCDWRQLSNQEIKDIYESHLCKVK